MNWKNFVITWGKYLGFTKLIRPNSSGSLSKAELKQSKRKLFKCAILRLS